ncbi:MAG: internal scaffolding protein [Microvirus sp.]|nr:MAG: internal scaffolding protein [Microvirus sp.]
MAKTNTFPLRVRDRWFDSSSVGTIVFGESLTKQEFASECDINQILARFQESPPRAWGNPPQLRYGEFADAPDFLAAQLLVKDAEALFNSIPAPVRERFGDNPANFLGFLHDPKNADEARRLGLVNPLPAAPPAPVEPPK